MGYKRGQEVMRCKPFAHIIYASQVANFCDFCLTSKMQINLRHCSACKITYYCGVKCQKQAWTIYHREECFYFRKTSPEVPADLIRMMFRLILKLNKDGQNEDFETLPNGHKRHFKDLMSHTEEIANDQKMMKGCRDGNNKLEGFDTLFDVLQSCLKHTDIMKTKILEKTEVLEIFGKYVTNSLCVYDVCIGPIGSGIYLGASVLDHSCFPNAIWIHDKKELIIRTIDEVEDFSSLRVSYISKLYERTKERRHFLMIDYYFFCECSRCLEIDEDQEKTSVKCSTCQGCVPCQTQICVDCKIRTDSSVIEKHKNTISKMLSIKYDFSTKIETYRKLYDEALEIIHPYDKDFMEFLNIYYEKEKNVANHEKCLEILKLILINVYHNYPKYDSNIGSKETWVAGTCLKLNKLDEAEEHIDKAETILRISYGDDHPLITQMCAQIRHDIDMKRLIDQTAKR